MSTHNTKITGWYAYFESTAAVELFHASEINKRYPKDKFDHRKNLYHFKTLREARAYLYMNLRGEISDARMNIEMIRSIKANGRK